jgi:hypothetical protein
MFVMRKTMTSNEQKLRRLISNEIKTVIKESVRPRQSLVSLIFEDKSKNLKDVAPEAVAPTELDKVDPVIAKVIVKSGEMDKDKGDDVIKVSPKSWPAADLKPSQTTMRIEGTISMAFSMLAGTMDTNLGCIISSDNHIMDGHHRWSAAILVDPSSTVSGFGAELPGNELVGVLNVLTKGIFGKSKGNPGKGSIASYTPENVKSAIEKFLEAGSKHVKPDKAKELLEEKFGSVEKGVETMSKNVESMSKDVPGWAPDRAQMPVIDPKEVPAAAKALSSGKVDVKPPYSAVVKRSFSGAEKSATSKKDSKKDSKKEESHGVSGDVLIERWQKLAGLIK